MTRQTARRPPVHPRECGERRVEYIGLLVGAGSSPRVRGTRRCAADRGFRQRFIPASAGNARALVLRVVEAPVHPRECGERGRVNTHERLEYGSSPRVRGTRPAGAVGHARCRFIPASAGNAGPWMGHRTGRSVHPRECGERPYHAAGAVVDVGSSPRVRGTLHAPQPQPSTPRFIPASAGNARGGIL